MDGPSAVSDYDIAEENKNNDGIASNIRRAEVNTKSGSQDITSPGEEIKDGVCEGTINQTESPRKGTE